ncbi:MAG: ATP-binding protein, partial [Mariniphaga sp.]
LIFFCGNEGIDFFNPEEVSDFSEPQTKVLITDFWIDGEPYFPDKNNGKSSSVKLELSHRHKILSIRFTALDFSNTGIKKFRYKLEGIHNDWVYLQNEQMASFTHLPPGKYTFRVETQQKNNEWTGNNSTIEIFVKRPFWLSVPFYIFVFLVSPAVVYFFTKARSKVLIMRQRELEKIIRERTLELTQKNRELEIANQTKDKFFSIISHDLRSPFSGLLGILDLLTDEENTLSQEEQKGLLQSAKSSAHNTYELLENLLLWARSQMRTTTISAKKQNLSEVLKKNITLKRAIANQKKITLSGNFPDNLEALFDREMINTVIRNILSNAIKFTPLGGHVNLYATAKNDEVTISIADTGIGIEKNDAARLFDLDKVNRAGTRGEKGTGLGLVICKEFVNNNNGRIWAESNKPQGTVFHFTLPAAHN